MECVHMFLYATEMTLNLSVFNLTHWGRVTHICVSKLTIIGSDNGLSPGRCQAIIWTNAGVLLIGPWGTNFNETSIEFHTFSFKKIHLKLSSGKWRSFCFGLNVLTMWIGRYTYTDVYCEIQPMMISIRGDYQDFLFKPGEGLTMINRSKISTYHNEGNYACSIGCRSFEEDRWMLPQRRVNKGDDELPPVTLMSSFVSGLSKYWGRAITGHGPRNCAHMAPKRIIWRHMSVIASQITNCQFDCL